LPSPVAASVSAFIAKAKRDLKEDPGGKAAVTRFHIIEIAKRLKNDPIQIRNRAMILVTFASGWRRSESTGLLYSDVRFVKEGMTLWLRKSKTDQEGKGRLVGIHSGRSAVACPVRALKAWLKIRGKWDGPLFVAFTPRRAITRDGLGGRG
jgi:site-specific recombinase XerC